MSTISGEGVVARLHPDGTELQMLQLRTLSFAMP